MESNLKKLDKDSWIFAVIQDPGANEQYFGLYDDEADLSYIPAFLNKDDAVSCLINLPTQKGVKYEVQAVIFEDLSKDAFENNFLLFLLDGDGKILKKINPEPTL